MLPDGVVQLNSNNRRSSSTVASQETSLGKGAVAAPLLECSLGNVPPKKAVAVRESREEVSSSSSAVCLSSLAATLTSNVVLLAVLRGLHFGLAIFSWTRAVHKLSLRDELSATAMESSSSSSAAGTAARASSEEDDSSDEEES